MDELDHVFQNPCFGLNFPDGLHDVLLHVTSASLLVVIAHSATLEESFSASVERCASSPGLPTSQHCCLSEETTLNCWTQVSGAS